MSKKKQMVSFLANDGKPFRAQKTGRNYLCRCGSGLKAKKCCGTETKYFLPKPKEVPQNPNITEDEKVD